MRIVNIPARQAAATVKLTPLPRCVCVPVNQQRNCGCAFPADDPQRARLPRASQPYWCDSLRFHVARRR